MDHGLMHVALSRVTKFNCIRLIDRTSMNRLCKAIARHSKIEGRINDEKRLQMLCESTLRYFSSIFSSIFSSVFSSISICCCNLNFF